MTNRRQFLRELAGGLMVVGAGTLAPRLVRAGEAPSMDTPGLPAGTLEESFLHALHDKQPLIKRSFRPPNYETPLAVFNEPFTPNDAFFVRYHLSNIPAVGTKEWKLEVGGDSVEKPMALTYDDLTKGYEPVEIAAVCQCSGNRRGLSDPHVPGVEWGYGAMGNARWKGVRLKDVLAKAGVKKEAVEVVMNGADSPPLPATPDFVKSLPVWKALDENTLLAFEMNGAPIPHWNGHPVRLVVPGWTATYWTKHIVSIQVVSQPFKGFWMASAYRIPKGKFPIVDRFLSQETEANTPITEMVVNSLITNIKSGQRFQIGQRVEVKGIAWDAGFGLQGVDVSSDGGQSWRPAQLAEDHGKFSWRQWSHAFNAERKGVRMVMARATNRLGASQPFELIFNPAGYHNNVVQRIDVQVV
jgi:DMSO/TMAO reductase YedYZ molybdopterin-dependent catalytic subunit